MQDALAIEHQPGLAAFDVDGCSSRLRGVDLLEQGLHGGLELLVRRIAEGGGLVERVPRCSTLGWDRVRDGDSRLRGGWWRRKRAMPTHEVEDAKCDDDGDQDVVAGAKAHWPILKLCRWDRPPGAGLNRHASLVILRIIAE